MTFYTRFPEEIKDIARFVYSFVPIEKRMGKKYWELRNFLKFAQWWNAEKIAAWQLAKLKEILDFAYFNVPGYFELYRNAGISPNDVRNLEDVEYLPFTTKQLIRDNIKDFTTRTIPSHKMHYITTSGSTGIPFGFFHTCSNKWVENAFMHTGWMRSGWQMGKPSLVLRGAFVGTRDKFNSYTRLQNEYNLSAYFLTAESYKKYLDFILKIKPFFIQAYPSALVILSDLIFENGDEGKVDVQVLLLGSENLYTWQKLKIQKAFPNAHIFSWYGHAEQVVLAPWCESLDVFHSWPFYSFTELINEEDQKTEVGKVGEIVGTSFWNIGTPFIRYRTMDLAENGGVGCSSCNRNFPIFTKIEGRLQEFIVTSTGRYISMTAINMHSDTFDDVLQFQFFQETPGKVFLKIVPKPNYSEISAIKIFRTIKSKLSEDVDLTLELVNEIPRTRSGKHRFLDQRMNIRYGDKG